MSAWTTQDDALAQREGWAVFDFDGTGLLEIEHLDCQEIEGAPTLSSDYEALQIVRAKALAGSPLHIRALAIHEQDAKAIDARRCSRKPWKAVRCFADNAPDYWIVTRRSFGGEVASRHPTEAEAIATAGALNVQEGRQS